MIVNIYRERIDQYFDYVAEKNTTDYDDHSIIFDVVDKEKKEEKVD